MATCAISSRITRLIPKGVNYIAGRTIVSVTPQVFDLLEYLIRNRERVVSKDDLVERHLERAYRIRCGADDPSERRPKRDRRFRRGTAPDQNASTQGLSLRRYRCGKREEFRERCTFADEPLKSQTAALALHDKPSIAVVAIRRT